MVKFSPDFRKKKQHATEQVSIEKCNRWWLLDSKKKLMRMNPRTLDRQWNGRSSRFFRTFPKGFFVKFVKIFENFIKKKIRKKFIIWWLIFHFEWFWREITRLGIEIEIFLLGSYIFEWVFVFWYFCINHIENDINLNRLIGKKGVDYFIFDMLNYIYLFWFGLRKAWFTVIIARIDRRTVGLFTPKKSTHGWRTRRL